MNATYSHVSRCTHTHTLEQSEELINGCWFAARKLRLGLESDRQEKKTKAVLHYTP